MMPTGVINGSTYLKKDNSPRKWSKCVKITRYMYVEQILGKKSTGFQRTPCVKRANGGTERVFPFAAGFKGAQPLTFIAELLWFLHGYKLCQFAGLGDSQQLHSSCVLCVSMQW